jgi:hypothetical protein
MSPELDKKLCEKYPEIFRDRHGDKMTTAMCWGFEHGDGWYNILDSMCHLIQARIDSDSNYIKWCLENGTTPPEKIPQVVAVQAKEKFGTLRFYYDGGDNIIHGVVAMAEEISGHICEVCGDAGKIRDEGWIRTLCDKHARQDDDSYELEHHPV